MAQTFDEAELLERVDNDREFLAETVEMLVSDGPALLAQIRAGVAAGDAAAVGKHAHTLKGMISNFCAPDAQACALEVERIGKGGDLGAAPAAVETLETRVRALTDELTAFARSGA